MSIMSRFWYPLLTLSRVRSLNRQLSLSSGPNRTLWTPQVSAAIGNADRALRLPAPITCLWDGHGVGRDTSQANDTDKLMLGVCPVEMLG